MSLAIAAGCGGSTNQPERGVAVGGTGGGVIETGRGPSPTGGTVASSATGGNGVQGGAAGNTQGGNSTAGGAAACVNADCVAAHSDPYTCINGQCRPLLTAECPVLLPEDSAGQYSARELLKKPAPIIVGGFATMSNAANLYDTLAVVNWNLALTEFNSITSGGLQSYDGSGVPRPLIGLICQGYNATTALVDKSMAHLTQDIHVPAVLSTLTATNLLEAYNFTTSSSYVANNGQPVFFMSSGSATMQLASLNDNGFVWHMLGNPRLIAATAAALVKRIEPAVRAARQSNFEKTGADDPSVDSSLRVTLIYSDDATMLDIHDGLLNDPGHPEDLLTFNNAFATDASNSTYFHQTQVASGSTTVAAATTSVQTYPPHIIVALGTSEFARSILPAIESTWSMIAPGQMRPFYVVSPLLYNRPDLRNALGNQSYGVENRLVGFNYAGLEDSHTQSLYDAYYARLVASYNSGGALANLLASTENMYDAAYYLLYSIAAAEVNRKPSELITGTDVLTGLLEKVIKSSSPYQDTGTSNLSSVLAQLQGSDSQFSMALWGVGGPPNFDTTTGTRTLATAAWCMNYDATLSPPAYVYAADGLIFDPTNQTFTAPAGGVPACLQKY